MAPTCLAVEMDLETNNPEERTLVSVRDQRPRTFRTSSNQIWYIAGSRVGRDPRLFLSLRRGPNVLLSHCLFCYHDVQGAGSRSSMTAFGIPA